MNRTPSPVPGFPLSRVGLAVARWLALAPAAVLAVSASAAAGGAEPGSSGTVAVPVADVVDGRARWREPARADGRADGRADWAVDRPPRLSAATAAPARATDVTLPSATGGPRWVDVVVDGDLKRVPRLRPAVPPAADDDVSGTDSARVATPSTVESDSDAAAPGPKVAPDSNPEPTPAPTPIPAPDVARAVLPRDERPGRDGQDRAPPSPAGARPERGAPEPSPDGTDALAAWLRELGIATGADGRPCPTRDELLAALRVRPTRASDALDDDALARLLDALTADVNQRPLDAGISRDWSVLRFGCEPAIDIVLEEGPDGPPSSGSAADLGVGTPTTADEAGDAPAPSGSDPDEAGSDGDPKDRESADDDIDDGALAGDGPGDGELPEEETLDDELPEDGLPGAALPGVPLPEGAPPGGALAGGVLPGAGLPDVESPFGTDEPPLDAAAPDTDGGIESGLFFVDDDDVPPGFEMLAEPQTVFVDVRFNGRAVGATLVTTTADELLFDAPAEVAAMLPYIEDPELLTELLSAPLAPNVHRVCFRPDDPLGCGVVEPTPVAVIYDENSLTVDLFVAGALQSVQAQEAARHLPAPERRAASILSLHSAASKTPGTDGTFDLSARLLAGYGGGHVTAAADYGSVSEEARLNELKLTHIARGRELTAGTYSWGPGGALSDVALLGVGFATSFRTRLDLEQAFSSETIVYLRRRAVVQILVDGRVQSGDSYEAGNQPLDTRALPDGTYPIEIRIIESDGTTRSEFRTFTKSALLPPRGEPVFSATAGVARLDGELFPDGVEPLVAGFNVAQRLGDRSSLTVGAAQLGRDGFGQSEFVYLGERLTLQAAFTIGRERTLGTNLNVASSIGRTRFGASWRSFRSDVVRADDATRESVYPTDGEEWGVTATRGFGRTSVGVSAGRGRSQADGEAPRDTTRYEVRASRPLFRRRDSSGSLSANVQDIDGERFAFLRLDVSFGRDTWSSGLGLDAASTPDGSAELGRSARVGYSASGAGFDWNAGLSARRATSDSAAARLDAEHSLFGASAAHLVDIAPDGVERTSSVATLSTQIGLDLQGGAIGGTGMTQSGVIVAVDGEPAGEPFDIHVNGARAAVGQIGATRFIGLQPFESYAIKIVPRGVLSNGLGEDVHEFTLFPGNVQRIDVRAESRVLLIAEVVDERGAPLASAVVQDGETPLLVDADGLLQAELPPGGSFEVRPLEGGTCTITTPAAPPGTEVQVADEPLVCRVGAGGEGDDGTEEG